MHIGLLAGSTFVRLHGAFGWRFLPALESFACCASSVLKHWHISSQNAAQKRWFCGALCRLREKPDSRRVFPKADLEYRLKSFGPTRRHAPGSIHFDRRKNAGMPRACAPHARREESHVRNYKITSNVVRQTCLRVVCGRFCGWLGQHVAFSLFGCEIRRRHVFVHVPRFRVHYWPCVAAA